MPTNASKAFPALLLAALLYNFASARDLGGLTGTWQLVPAQSDFAGQPAVQSGTVTITDQQGIIAVTRNFVYDGAHETFFYHDNTGSENNQTIHSAGDVKSKTRWHHGELKVTTTQSGTATVETYSLADDGTMKVRVEKPGQPPLTLLFHRETAK